MNPLDGPLEWALLGILMPVWLLAGFADWACHRALRIEHSAGLRESLLHLLMLAELGIGVLAGFFLQRNAASYAIVLAACLAHEATLWVDLSYAESKRGIPWYEQWVHGLQQALPWVALVGLMLLDWPQAMALFGLGDAPPDWRLRPTTEPLPRWYLGTFFSAALLLVVLPFAGELLRCWRHGGGRPAATIEAPGS
jgi:hypothetical protein